MSRLIAVFTAMFFSSLPALALAQEGPPAGVPPKGSYTCSISPLTFVHVGTLEIQSGMMYGFSDGSRKTDSGSFSLESNGHLQYFGTMGSLTRPPASITDSWVERDGANLSIIIKVQQHLDAPPQTIICRNA